MSKEPVIKDIVFKIHKFTPRKRPNSKDIVIFPIFSEFGCETLAVVYCLPLFMQKYCSGKYTVVMGWHGREYFYRHLVDEFWEIPKEFMWLREYCRAFNHTSRNLRRVENKVKKFGQVMDITHLGNTAVFPKMQECLKCKGSIVCEEMQVCCKCGTIYPSPGIFHDIIKSKELAKWLPMPSKEKMDKVKKYLPRNAVGITARNRKTYGRNLEPIFYERLIYLLEDLGYNPVWIGETATSLLCPFKRIVDFSSTEDANDLELTLALVSQLEFTVQFWTASTRLAALVGTPYIIFESPDQIWGVGQEGMRLNLITRGKRKMVISHFKSISKDHTAGLSLVRQAVDEMNNGDFDDIIGLVENQDYVKNMKSSQSRRIGSFC